MSTASSSAGWQQITARDASQPLASWDLCHDYVFHRHAVLLRRRSHPSALPTGLAAQPAAERLESEVTGAAGRTDGELRGTHPGTAVRGRLFRYCAWGNTMSLQKEGPQKLSSWSFNRTSVSATCRSVHWPTHAAMTMARNMIISCERRWHHHKTISFHISTLFAGISVLYSFSSLSYNITCMLSRRKQTQAHWKAVSLVSTPRSVRASPGNSHSQNRALRSGPPLAMLAFTASYTALQHGVCANVCHTHVHYF